MYSWPGLSGPSYSEETLILKRQHFHKYILQLNDIVKWPPVIQGQYAENHAYYCLFEAGSAPAKKS